jgi:uncharacterized protein (DUF924 family)
MSYEKVIDFWFSELTPSNWYEKSEPLDNKIKDLFLKTYNKAICGELFSWRETMKGRLAEIIVLDQFSRNMFRDDAKAFQYDSLALTLSQEASTQSSLSDLSTVQKSFLYMPFMHSESLIIHDEAVRLFSETGLENNLNFELRHKKIIERFGRYPHRNKILGRESSAEEIEFLKEAGSSF